MTKEFLVRSFMTEALALHALRAKFSSYLAAKNITDWKWLHRPEALHGEDGWRAYGRVEWLSCVTD